MQDVSEICAHDSGYEIAKDLESSGKKASYDIDTSFIEYLDDFAYHKGKIHTQNIKDWVAAHNPQPKFNKGQKLLVNTFLNNQKRKGAIVYVTGINEKEAYYTIDENPLKNGGTVIDYEKVETNCTPI